MILVFHLTCNESFLLMLCVIFFMPSQQVSISIDSSIIGHLGQSLLTVPSSYI